MEQPRKLYQANDLSYSTAEDLTRLTPAVHCISKIFYFLGFPNESVTNRGPCTISRLSKDGGRFPSPDRAIWKMLTLRDLA